MLTSLLALTLCQLPTPLDFLDNAEIGDAVQYVALRSKGAWEAHGLDKAKGNTLSTGKWSIEDDVLTVKVTGCKGPACKEQKKDFTAKVAVMAPRAMTVDSTAPAPLFPSGSYYCHHLGCEQRIGVEILSKGANLKSLQAIEDHLISKNVGRDSTVVWIGPRPEVVTKKTRVEVCGRDLERAKAALVTLEADLAGAAWFGEYVVDEMPKQDCLWDLRLYVNDTIEPPALKRRRAP